MTGPPSVFDQPRRRYGILLRDAAEVGFAGMNVGLHVAIEADDPPRSEQLERDRRGRRRR